MRIEPIKWDNNTIVFIDQTQLPLRLKFVRCKKIGELCLAIRTMQIRGAPLIGVAVALGYAMVAVNSGAKTITSLAKELRRAVISLKNTRPTANNLFWALDRMEKIFHNCIDMGYSTEMCKRTIVSEALSILKEDRLMCSSIGRNGAKIIRDDDIILTHCNAGMLATSGSGTALSILYEAKRMGRRFRVYVDETRPLLQGARLTMWELERHNIDATLICDNMAASVIKTKGVTKIIVGADRIAANGDTANKIGTYGLAVLARYHKIPFYVAAPSSTIDKGISSGKYITIEERKKEELIFVGHRQVAPGDAKVFNPAFDVTPAKLITAIITEKGIYAPEEIRRV